ncbi:protein of unknown function [Cupriavidus taiwanensis]|nr:hypothetical protein CBM2606_A90526 [Cupriavidus taiwanensis]SPA41996.1 protein of unknown function [Cupriavidus taiwanensis]
MSRETLLHLIFLANSFRTSYRDTANIYVAVSALEANKVN